MSMTKGTPASSQIIWLEQRVQELSDELLRIRSQEPVMTIGVDESEKCRSLPAGMKLYAAPPAQPAPAQERDDLVNGLMSSTISETCRADAAEAAIESIVELLDHHADDMHVTHGSRPADAVRKARDIAIAAMIAAAKDKP